MLDAMLAFSIAPNTDYIVAEGQYFNNLMKEVTI